MPVLPPRPDGPITAERTQRAPWKPVPGESPADYSRFLLWLEAPDPRPAPPARTAKAYDWFGRAAEYDLDRAADAPMPEAGLVIQRHQGVLDVFRLVVRNEIQKHLVASLESTAMLPVTLPELVSAYEKVIKAEALLRGRPTERLDVSHDLSGLSDEQLIYLDRVLAHTKPGT